MLFLYRISIGAYGWLVWIISFFNDKARLFISGRKNIFISLEQSIKKGDDKIIWIHAASVGEFEQGRPIIEEIKKAFTHCQILLTFFSPSGYELRKNYELADYVFYLPLDTPGNAKRFVETVKPDLAIFIKYEFWYFYLHNLQKHNIPTFLVSCILRENQFFSADPEVFYLQVLRRITHYFVQDQSSAELLKNIGISEYTVSGDTRFDRVVAIAAQAKEIPLAQAFKNNEKLWVLGSTWLSDIEVIKPFILKYCTKYKFLIAPHNIGESEIQKLLQLPESIRFSKADLNSIGLKRILIVDSIGMLSSLYSYADFAYVGGAFNGTLHNTLEPAVYGVPVFFGSDRNNLKFLEAQGLKDIGGGIEVSNDTALEERFLELASSEAMYSVVAKSSAEYVRNGTGATRKLMERLKPLL